MKQLFLLGLVGLLSVSCHRSDAVPVDERAAVSPVASAEPPDEPFDETAAACLYDLPMTLTDHSGAPLSLDAYRGHPVLITMFYSSCAYACPMLVADLKAIEAAMDPETRKATRVLLVSFDPARDSTAVLAELATKHKIDAARWHFARADEGDVRTLAAALGIKYRKLPDGNYNHSSIIALLDGRGGVVTRLDGAQQPSEALRARAKQIATAKP